MRTTLPAAFLTSIDIEVEAPGWLHEKVALPSFSVELSVVAVTCLPIIDTPSDRLVPVFMPTRAASRSLVTNCCSTPVIEVICWVIWVVSVGDSGSWFFSWVVSSLRNVCSLLASDVRELLILLRTDEVFCEETAVVMARFFLRSGCPDRCRRPSSGRAAVRG